MKRRIFIIISIIIISLTIVTTLYLNITKFMTESNFKHVVTENVITKKTFPNGDFKFEEIAYYKLNKGTFIHVLLKSKEGKLFQGVYLTNTDEKGKYKKSNYASLWGVDMITPITLDEICISPEEKAINGKVKPEDKFNILCGVLNNKNIKSIEAKYKDGFNVSISPEKRLYGYPYEGNDRDLRQLQAFDKNHNLIFEYPLVTQ